MLFALRDIEERRLCQIYMSLLDQLRHEVIDKGQHQGGNVSTVHIRIRHDDDLVVAKLRNVEVLIDAGTEGRDHALDFLVGIDPVQPGLLHIQHLAAKRKHRLGIHIPSVLCRSQGRISLYDEDLTFLGIPAVAVHQLAGKTHALQCGLSAGQIPRSSGGCPGTLRQYGFFAHDLRHRGVLLQKIGKLLGNDALHRSLGLRGTQLLLRLSLELRILNLHRDNAGEALTNVLAGEIGLRILQELMLPGIVVEGFCQCIFKTGKVGTALRGIDVVDEGIDVLRIGIVVLHGNLNEDLLPLTLAVDHLGIQRLLALVQVGNKFLDTALVVEGLLLGLFLPGILQYDFQSLRQEGGLPKTHLQSVIIVNRLLEDLRIRQEGYCGAVLILRALSHNGHGLHHLAPGKGHAVFLAFLENGNRQPL